MAFEKAAYGPAQAQLTAAKAEAMLAHAAKAQAPLPTGYVPLTPEGLLFFCQSQLQKMDEDIQKKMQGQNGLVALQGEVTNIQNLLKARTHAGAADAAYVFDDKVVLDNFLALVDSAIANATASGEKGLITNLNAVRAKLTDGSNNSVSEQEVKEICTMLDTSLAACRTGAEMSMIELQSLVAKRSTALQLTTGMMNSLNDGAKGIAGNIGR